MIVDPRTVPAAAMYRVLIGVVVPRPIAFVSTVSPDGRHNVSPFSFFNALSSEPPLIGIAINRRGKELKDTLRNIHDTGDFVVNIVHEELGVRMVQTSGDWPEDTSEFDVAGLTPTPSDRVKSPRVAESYVHLECRLDREIELGTTTLVVGEVVLAHVSDEVLTDGRVDITKLHPVGRLGGDEYAVIRHVVHMPRPKVERRPQRDR
jgi:flavin reductase (DIM6/NTAB) family NADH-FMN oxidoreductase RutF